MGWRGSNGGMAIVVTCAAFKAKQGTVVKLFGQQALDKKMFHRVGVFGYECFQKYALWLQVCCSAW